MRLLLVGLLGLIAPLAALAQADDDIGQANPWPLQTPTLEVCDNPLPLPPSNGGSLLVQPGSWRNPKREGTGWDVIVHESAVGTVYRLIWFTYSADRKPVWYISDPAGLTQNSTVIPPTILRRMTPTGGIGDQVGSVSAALYPGDPSKMAVSWQLLEHPGLGVQTECLQDALRPSGGRSPDTIFGYTGLWSDTTGTGKYAFANNLIGPDASGITTYIEILRSAIFDDSDFPVWTFSSRSLSTVPPVGQELTFDTIYTASQYPGGIPTTDCTVFTSCIASTPLSQVSARRTFLSIMQGQLTLQIPPITLFPSAQAPQSLNWTATNAPIVRDTPPQQILVNKYYCTFSEPAQACTFVVDWVIPLPSGNYRVRPVWVGAGAAPSLPGAITTTGSSFWQFSLGSGDYRFVLEQASQTGWSLRSQTPVVRSRPAIPVPVGLGFPSANTCPQFGSGTSSPTTPVVPGLYSNPDRNLTAWSVGFSGSPSSRVLSAIWYSFDAERRPVWYQVTNAQVENDPANPNLMRANAPLTMVRWTAGAPDPVNVGEASFLFSVNDARRVAIRWRHDDINPGSQSDECLTHNLDVATSPVSAPIYGGLWQQVGQEGYWIGEYSGTTENQGVYKQQSWVAAFDSANYPTWANTDVSIVTTAELAGSPTALPLRFFNSPYVSGVPTSTCTTGSCGTSPVSVGSIVREFDISGLTGSAQVVMSTSGMPTCANQPSSCVIQYLDWIRRLGNAPVWSGVAIQKYTDPHQITASPSSCELPPSGGCSINVNWGSALGSARAYRRNLSDNSAQALQPSLAVGSVNDILGSAGTYRYELHEADDPGSPLLGVSASVSILQPGSPPPEPGMDWSNSEPGTPTAPTAFTPPEPPTGEIEVGTTSGTFEVDSGGRSNYSIPIYVAPATAGFAPSIALSYSSGAGNGIAGVGFSITGISTIVRCRRTVEHGDGPGPHREIQFRDWEDAPTPSNPPGDAYCLDGQRLVPVGPVTNGRRPYKTESNPTANIFAYYEQAVPGGPSYWRVWTVDGVEHLYGLPGRTHSEAQCALPTSSGVPDSCNGRLLRNLAGTPRPEVMTWALSKSRNRAQTRAVIEYNYFVNHAEGEIVLAEIAFSGTDTMPNLRPSASIRFEYSRPGEDPPGTLRPNWDARLSYFSGAQMRSSHLLNRVDSYNADGQLARSYQLQYDYSSTSRRPRLRTITEKSGSNELRPTTFEWANATNQLGVLSSQPRFSDDRPFDELVDVKFADINGDSLVDAVWTEGEPNNSQRIAYGLGSVVNGEYRFGNVNTGLTLPARADNDRGWAMLDFNQDGRSDLMMVSCVVSCVWRVHLANGTGFETLPVSFNQTISAAGDSTDALFVDMNGDGLTDLLTPVASTGGNRLALHLLQRANSASPISCSISGGLQEDCPFEFSAPIPVELLSADSSFGVSFPKFKTDSFDIADVNGDGRADLKMRICPECANGQPGYRMVPGPDRITKGDKAVAGQETWYWAVLLNSGIGPKGQWVFEEFKRWTNNGTGSQVDGSGNGAFRLQDINGDGLADAIYRRGDVNLGSWWFELNTGAGFAEPKCVLEGTGPRSPTGYPCLVIPDQNQLLIADYDGDGDLDFWVAMSAGQELFCYSTSSAKAYSVLYFAEGRFSPPENAACPAELGVAFDVSDSERLLTLPIDLDNDAQLDLLQICKQEAPLSTARCETTGLNGGTGRYRSFRRVAAERYINRDALESIENGLGALIRVTYRPMSFADVYSPDFNAPFMMSGRGSAVMDFYGAGYLVGTVETSSPLEGDPAAMAAVLYRYAGAKAQGNGRGMLGFRKRFETDLQTLVQTEVEVEQAFPRTGLLRFQSQSRLSSAPPDVCASPESSACRVPVSFCQVSARNLNCDAFTNASNPLGESEFTYQLTSYGQSLSLTPGEMPGTPLAFYIEHSEQTVGKFIFDSITSTYESAGMDVHESSYALGPGLLSSKIVRQQGSTNERQELREDYERYRASAFPDMPLSILQSRTVSRVSQSSVEHYALDPYGNSTYGLSFTGAVVRTVRDSFGNARIIRHCQSGVPGLCASYTTAGNGDLIPADVSALPSQSNGAPLVELFDRSQVSGFDAKARFVDRAYQGYVDAAGSVSFAVATEVVSRNPLGQVTQLIDVNGVETRTSYTALGRKYFQYSGKQLGASWVPLDGGELTRAEWCGGEVSCPSGTVYRTKSIASTTWPAVSARVRPTVWTYHDVLGREVLRVTENLRQTVEDGSVRATFSAVKTAFDLSGRQVAVSEPYLLTSESPGTQEFVPSMPACGSGIFCTESSYDFLGRQVEVRKPDHSASAPVRTRAWFGVTNCVDGYGVDQSCLLTISTEPKYTGAAIPACGGEHVQCEYRSLRGNLIRVIGARANGSSQALSLTYRYDVDDNVIAVTRQPMDGDSSGQVISTLAQFDSLGRRTWLSDPDAGAREFEYNQLGELIREKTANGSCIQNWHDLNGRLVKREDFSNRDCEGSPIEVTTWTFDVADNGKGLLSAESSASVTRSHSYDVVSRPVSTDTVVAAAHGLPVRQYRQELTYDPYGRAFQVFDLVFPAGSPEAISATIARKVGVRYEYSDEGYQIAVHNAISTAQNPDPFYRVYSMDARGNVIRSRRADSVALETQVSLDAKTGRLSGIRSGVNGSIQDLRYDQYDLNGNLGRRTDYRSIAGGGVVTLAESFVYDGINRLESSTRFANGNAVGAEAYSYDQLGNFLTKGGDSQKTRTYPVGTSPQCQRTTLGPHMLAAARQGAGAWTLYCYDNNGNQTVAGLGIPGSNQPDQRYTTYTVFDKPSRVQMTASAGGLPAHEVHFEYGPGREMVRRSDGAPGALQKSVTHYIGNVEVTHEPDTGEQTQRREYKRYVGGFLIINMRTAVQGGALVKTSDRRYVFKDKLGSTDALVSANGTEVQRMAFDVWGMRRNAENWNSLSINELLGFNDSETRKGYTGHQQIDRANVIHMGGRVYDPRIGRFLNADPFVQSPFFTQSHNRYAYVFNNPMNYTDPSGYWADGGIGAALTWMAATYLISSAAQYAARNSDTAQGFVQIAQIAFTAYSLGSSVNSLAQSYTNSVLQRGLNGPLIAGDAGAVNQAPVLGPVESRGVAPAFDPASAALMPAVIAAATSPAGRARWANEFRDQKNAAGIAAGMFVGEAIVVTAVCVETAGGCLVLGWYQGYELHDAGHSEAGLLVAALSTIPALGGAVRRVAAEGVGVASGIGRAGPMHVERVIQRGERVADLINEAKALTFTTGNEHAVVTLANGQRALVSGGPGGINFSEGSITRIFGHSHPTNALPSAADVAATRALGQSKQYVFHGGEISIVRPVH